MVRTQIEFFASKSKAILTLTAPYALADLPPLVQAARIQPLSPARPALPVSHRHPDAVARRRPEVQTIEGSSPRPPLTRAARPIATARPHIAPETRPYNTDDIGRLDGFARPPLSQTGKAVLGITSEAVIGVEVRRPKLTALAEDAETDLETALHA